MPRTGMRRERSERRYLSVPSEWLKALLQHGLGQFAAREPRDKLQRQIPMAICEEASDRVVDELLSIGSFSQLPEKKLSQEGMESRRVVVAHEAKVGSSPEKTRCVFDAHKLSDKCRAD